MKLVIIAAAIALVGCNSDVAQKTENEQVQESASEVVQKNVYIEEDWKRDFQSAFELSNRKTDEDGISKYHACFDRQGEKCPVFFSGVRDGFRKVDHLTPLETSLIEFDVKYGLNNRGPAFVDMRVVAPTCKEAWVVLNPTLYAKEWLFMNTIALMADGDVVYEFEAPDVNSIKRDVDGNRIVENWTFLLKANEYDRLRKFSRAESKIIRITGQKGYMTLPKETVDVFAKDIVSVINAADTINEKLKAGGGPECTS